jgi:electron transfer flavoprotein beta subunit
VQFIINPNDEFGLTRAMWFKENQGASVDVINVGLQDTEPTLRKALAIGADAAIRVNSAATDSWNVAREIAKVATENNYDLIICGRESIDYNGGMVPGIIAALNNYNFITNCIALDIEGNTVNASREIDGGRENLKTTLPLVVGSQKGIVEESDLRIPNMRGIMMARKKPLNVIEPCFSEITAQVINFEKPAPKGDVKLVDAENIDELINLLHSEAKVI